MLQKRFKRHLSGGHLRIEYHGPHTMLYDMDVKPNGLVTNWNHGMAEAA